MAQDEPNLLKALLKVVMYLRFRVVHRRSKNELGLFLTEPCLYPKMMSPARYMWPDYMLAVAPSIYGGRLRSNPELIKKILHKVRAPSGLGYYWQLLSTVGWTSIHWLVTLRQPTLIIAGDDDPLFPIVNARFRESPSNGTESWSKQSFDA